MQSTFSVEQITFVLDHTQMITNFMFQLEARFNYIDILHQIGVGLVSVVYGYESYRNDKES